MSKQVTPEELAAIVNGLLTRTSPASRDLSPNAFSRLVTSVAEAVCGVCGGAITSPADDWADGEWLIGIVADEHLPEDGGVWKDVDPEGELFSRPIEA